MSILGIDYGKRKIGVAVCNFKIARPVTIIKYKKLNDVLAKLENIVEEHEVEKIVVGLPKNMDNSEGEMAKLANKFASEVEKKFKVPTILWDERLTTVQAKEMMHQAQFSRNKCRKLEDQIAAAIILQSYMDSLCT